MNDKTKKVVAMVFIIFLALAIIGSIIFIIYYNKSNQESEDIFNDLRNEYNNTIETSESTTPIESTSDNSQSTSQSNVELNTSSQTDVTSSSTTPQIITPQGNTRPQTTKPATSTEPEPPSDVLDSKLRELLNKNKYFVGWLSIDGTKIDYPIVQTKFDEHYYIHKNFNNKYSFAGVPFCSKFSDLKMPTDNIIIYGHNMLNGTMFSDLEKYKRQSFYENHKYIKFDTIYNKACVYEVVSVFRSNIAEEPYEFYYYVGGPKKVFDEFANFIKKQSMYEIPVDIEYGDKLLTLVTCTDYFGGSHDGRFVVVAKQIKGANLTTTEDTSTEKSNSQ